MGSRHIGNPDGAQVAIKKRDAVDSLWIDRYRPIFITIVDHREVPQGSVSDCSGPGRFKRLGYQIDGLFQSIHRKRGIR